MTSITSSPSTLRIGGGPLLPLRLSATILSDTMLGALRPPRPDSSTIVVLVLGLLSLISILSDLLLLRDLLLPRLDGPGSSLLTTAIS